MPSLVPHLLLLLWLLLALLSLCGPTVMSSQPPVAAREVGECNAARSRFSSMHLSDILGSLFSADVVLESESMPDADIKLRETNFLTVPVGCYHKGYLTSSHLRVALHPNYTKCIDVNTIDAELANGEKFVFFLRRLDNGSLVMLEGGVARSNKFNEQTSTICDLQGSHSARRACQHQTSAKCDKLDLFQKEFASEKRPAYIQPDEVSVEASVMPNDGVQTSYNRNSAATAAAVDRLDWSLVPALLVTALSCHVTQA